jgi:hypothetical protein
MNPNDSRKYFSPVGFLFFTDDSKANAYQPCALSIMDEDLQEDLWQR